MPSKTSFFNETLFCKNLTRFWPLWGMASFFGALLPLSLLVNWGSHITPLEFTELYYQVVAHAMPLVMLFYGILCAMAVWSYLYQHRSVSMMHALPITRAGLFVTNCLSGMAMIFIPCAVTGALCVLLSLLVRAFDPAGLGITVLAVAGEALFYFASATAVAFITGHIFALPALYFLFHFLAPLLDMMISAFAAKMIFGITGTYSGAAEALSPTVCLLRNLGVGAEYDNSYLANPNSSGSNFYSRRELTAVWLDHGWLIAVYAALGVVLLLIAYALYRRRRSECAGDVIAVGWMKPCFVLGLTACSALGGGQLLYQLFLDDASPYALIPLIVSFFVAGAIGYYAGRMLLAKSLRVFRGSVPALAAIALAGAAVISALYFDLPGIAARVPAESEVQSVSLDVAQNLYTLTPGEPALEELRTLHRAIIADRNYIRASRSSPPPTLPNGKAQWDFEYVHISYLLKNGRSVHREYSLFLTRERMDIPGTYDDLLNRLVNSPAMREKTLYADSPEYTVQGGYVNYFRDGRYLELGTREAQRLLAAVRRDAEAGTWGVTDWFGDKQLGEYAMECSFYFTARDPGGDLAGRQYRSVSLNPRMTNTVRCLKELGLAEDWELVTNDELNEINQRGVDEYALDGAAEYALDEAAS